LYSKVKINVNEKDKKGIISEAISQFTENSSGHTTGGAKIPNI
jgi:hypothetical protein